MSEYRDNARRVVADAKWSFWKLLGLGLLIFVVASVVAVPLGLWQSALGVMERTINPDNIIYNYEWFHSKNQAFVAYSRQRSDFDAKVVAFRTDAGPRTDWSRVDREEYSHLTNTRDGLAQHCRDIAADYNARSSMANRSIFKSGDLPTTLPIE